VSRHALAYVTANRRTTLTDIAQGDERTELAHMHAVDGTPFWMCVRRALGADGREQRRSARQMQSFTQLPAYQRQLCAQCGVGS
jgi:hypothetical protein